MLLSFLLSITLAQAAAAVSSLLLELCNGPLGVERLESGKWINRGCVGLDGRHVMGNRLARQGALYCANLLVGTMEGYNSLVMLLDPRVNDKAIDDAPRFCGLNGAGAFDCSFKALPVDSKLELEYAQGKGNGYVQAQLNHNRDFISSTQADGGVLVSVAKEKASPSFMAKDHTHRIWCDRGGRDNLNAYNQAMRALNQQRIRSFFPSSNEPGGSDGSFEIPPVQ
ncbi:MAG: hypothetical protein M1829_005205 [Trizodia sp. TS-e1964]|nr:MAG: hypothetical protein M1829_005205 [Trizodia sp. TS-e1964]